MNIGRGLFSLIFIITSFSHFSSQTINYAANHGVPLAPVLIPLSGILIMLGYNARLGAFLIILFLVSVTLMMHNYYSPYH